jgi:hypothetical protein
MAVSEDPRPLANAVPWGGSEDPRPLANAVPWGGSEDPRPLAEDPRPRTIDWAVAHAVALTFAGRRSEAATTMDVALAAAPAGNGGWILPVEPLLQAGGPEWEPALARLRSRAS